MVRRPEPEAVRRVACVGAGVVGCGWTALFLARGFDVVVVDPAPEAETAMHARLAAAWPHLERLGLARGASVDRVRFTTDSESAVADAEFVQESAPDDEELKIGLLSTVSAAARPDVVIASSSSGFLPSRLASQCIEPGRVIVGHPLVPTHLIPLVEVVGGEGTDETVLDWAVRFYGIVGKRPLKLNRECEAYVANRLQRALFDEAIRLVEAGICSFEEIDVAVTHGFGLRAPVLGPVLHHHLAGGTGGVRHMLEHFGWRGSEASAHALIAAIERRWGHASIPELEWWRDAGLVRILESLKQPP